MKNVANDKGSFTLEASLVSIFIMAIIVNLLLLILQMYDRCLIHEEINRSMVLLNMEYEGIKEIDKDEMVKEYENIRINKDLFCTNVLDVSYRIKQEEIEAKIVYEIKDSSIAMAGIVKKDKYYINRKMKLFDIKNYVRKNGKSCR